MTEHKKHGWAAKQYPGFDEANFGGIDDGFDYTAAQERDLREMEPSLIRDRILGLLNDGRIEEARDINLWLIDELRRRRSYQEAAE